MPRPRPTDGFPRKGEAGAARAADYEVVEKLRVECLGCGEARSVLTAGPLRLDPGECARCGYIGWAPSNSLTEAMRRRIRERPIDRRARLYAV